MLHIKVCMHLMMCNIVVVDKFCNPSVCILLDSILWLSIFLFEIMQMLQVMIIVTLLGRVEVKNQDTQTELVETEDQHVQAGKMFHKQRASFNFPYSKIS